ncbi:MAG TPA: hypothetical protein VGS19_38155 [Streptosporangiaceae bacterium]|nr:hypothetical protein [Streptosporangiaceae bacterium]
MCSDSDYNLHLARIKQAIDELATATPGTAEDPEMAQRLARLWAMLAELDPAMAVRLAGYFPDTP